MQDIRPIDLSAYATASDLAGLAILVDGKIDLAGDETIGNLWLGTNNQLPPVGTATRYIIVSGSSNGASDHGGLILQGSGNGNSTCGEIRFTGANRRYARILGRGEAGSPAFGSLSFFVDVSGSEVLGMNITGAGVVDFGGITGTAAANVTANNYSFSGQTYAITVRNLGNSATNGAGVRFQATGSTGTIIDIGYLAMRKTAVTTTTSTADCIVSVPNASATPAEAMRIKGDGGVFATYRSGASDPTTSDVAAGFCVDWLNTTSGELRRWANVAGVMRKSAAMT